MAIFLMVDGWVAPVTPAKAFTGFALDELYQILDCTTIEVVKLADGRLMVIDEDGRAKRLPVNLAATALYVEAGGPTGWAIVGNVVICEKGELL